MGGALTQVVGIAASAEVAIVDGAPVRKIKLLPIGKIEMRDARGPFVIRDRAHADQVVAATRKFLGGADMMIDYDHQVLAARPGGAGTKAIAAGWIKPATLTVEDDGIYAEPEWTEAAAGHLAAREYRYLSPLFMAGRGDGAVQHIKNVALVNIGAIDLPAVAAGITGENDDMTLALVAAALGLSADATAEQCVEQIDALKKPATSAIAIAAGLAENATAEEIAAAVTTIKAEKKPDLSGYVPASVVDGLKSQLSVLNDDRLGKKVDALVAAGIVIPAKREDTLKWFQTDEVAATAFFKDMPALVAPGAELDGRKPGQKATTLTADEIAACEMTGMSHEDFLAAKNAEIA